MVFLEGYLERREYEAVRVGCWPRRTGFLKEEVPGTQTHRETVMRGHKAKMAVCQPRTEASEGTNPAVPWSGAPSLQN